MVPNKFQLESVRLDNETFIHPIKDLFQFPRKNNITGGNVNNSSA